MHLERHGLVLRRLAFVALASVSSAALANISSLELRASDGGWSDTIGGNASANLFLSSDNGTTFINAGNGPATAIDFATTNPGSYTYQFFAYNGSSDSLVLRLFTPGGTIAATTAKNTASTSFAAIAGGTTTVADGGNNVTLTGLSFTNSSGPALHFSAIPGTVNTPNIVGQFTYTVAAPVPEPESYALFMAGLGVMGFVARRRKQK